MSQYETVPTDASSAASLRQIEEALRNLRFGEVRVVVQDGVVVQVERIERMRLPGRPRPR
jgi:hypothetical protein